MAMNHEFQHFLAAPSTSQHANDGYFTSVFVAGYLNRELHKNR
jgi:hypothetical protein